MSVWDKRYQDGVFVEWYCGFDHVLPLFERFVPKVIALVCVRRWRICRAYWIQGLCSRPAIVFTSNVPAHCFTNHAVGAWAQGFREVFLRRGREAVGYKFEIPHTMYTAQGRANAGQESYSLATTACTHDPCRPTRGARVRVPVFDGCVYACASSPLSRRGIPYANLSALKNWFEPVQVTAGLNHGASLDRCNLAFGHREHVGMADGAYVHTWERIIL